MGWTPHYHAYAFRRVHVVPYPEKPNEWNLATSMEDRRLFHSQQLALCAVRHPPKSVQAQNLVLLMGSWKRTGVPRS